MRAVDVRRRHHAADARAAVLAPARRPAAAAAAAARGAGCRRRASYASRVDELSITFRAIAEPQPGARFQARFEEAWPTYRSWFLREGEAARPSYAVARRMLGEHMPELVPAWTRLVELAGGGDLAARMLALYDPPPLVAGCSQAVLAGEAPVLVRNYDFDPARLDGVIAHTALLGRGVIGMTDCLWGLLDGMNEAGLAVSLTFGGRRAGGAGFGITLVLRYLLETCETTAQAVRTLERLPVQGAYNLTLLDRSGDAATAYLAADRRLRVERALVATNHQRAVEWPEHARATRTLERERAILALLAEPATRAEDLIAAFLAPPLHTTAYADGFGTLYTAVHRPADGAVEYLWPGASWRQSFAAFEQGERSIALPPPLRAAA
jgi:predicted choloylglycine hydrolase